MSEATTETVTEAPSESELGDGGKKALAAERATARAEKKRADELEARLKDLEQRDLSELEKANAKAGEHESRATAAEARALRLEVAFEKGLTPAQAKRLVGSTRDELVTDATEILRDFPVGTDKPGPRPDLTQGNSSKPAAASPGQDFATFINTQLGR